MILVSGLGDVIFDDNIVFINLGMFVGGSDYGDGMLELGLVVILSFGIDIIIVW